MYYLMTDFIQIDKDTFLRYKDKVQNSPECTKIIQKISGILEGYSCFKEFSSFQSYTKTKKNVHFTSNHHTPHHHNRQGQHAHPHVAMVRKPICNPNQSRTERDVTALLNKISKRTFVKISREILHIVTINNIEGITKNILFQCQKQPSFLDLYVNVLHDIYVRSSHDIKLQVQTQLSKYMEDFIDKRQFTNYQLDSSDYGEFCSNLDNKSQIIGKHKTILAIISKILRGTLIDEYFNLMFNEIIQLDKCSDARDVANNDFEKHELLLDIMTDFVKTDQRYLLLVNKYYSTHVTTLAQYSLKARFKVMNITEIAIVIKGSNCT